MSLSAETALRWAELPSVTTRMLLILYAQSQQSAEDGWSPPATKRTLMGVNHISPSASRKIFEVVEHEFDTRDEAGGARSYRYPGDRKSIVGRPRWPYKAIGNRSRRQLGDRKSIAQAARRSEIDRLQGAEQIDADPKSEEGAAVGLGGGGRIDRNSIAGNGERSISDRIGEGIDRKSIAQAARRSEIDRDGQARGDVKESFTESIPDPDSDLGPLRDNATTATVAVDVRELLKMSIGRIMATAGRGEFPRERMLEVAEAEEIVANEEDRKARITLIQRATEFHFSAPQAEARKMFGAICTAFGYEAPTLTITEQGVINRVASQLVKAGRKPEDVPAIHAFCKRQNWNGTFTPAALVKHASEALKARRYSLPEQDEPPDAEAAAEVVYPDWWEQGVRDKGQGGLTPYDAWFQTRGALELHWGKAGASRLEGYQLVRFEQSTFTFVADEPFQRQWFNLRVSVIREMLTKYYGQVCDVKLLLWDEVLAEQEVAG